MNAHAGEENCNRLTKATIAAASTNYTAVAFRERPAAKVSFQWHRPSFLPDKIVNSAVSPVPAARQFSGEYANCAIELHNLHQIIRLSTKSRPSE